MKCIINFCIICAYNIITHSKIVPSIHLRRVGVSSAILRGSVCLGSSESGERHHDPARLQQPEVDGTPRDLVFCLFDLGLCIVDGFGAYLCMCAAIMCMCLAKFYSGSVSSSAAYIF